MRKKKQDIYDVAYDLGVNFLNNLDYNPRYCVMFDIDDTLINYNGDAIKPMLKLLKECINVAKHSGYDRISSSVKKNNMPSQNMVKKIGFKQHYSDGNKDLFILELD